MERSYQPERNLNFACIDPGAAGAAETLLVIRFRDLWLGVKLPLGAR